MKKLIILLLLSFITVPVFAADYSERLMEEKYRKALNSGCEYIEIKNPTTATLMGLLPGGGSFYNGQMALGIVDLLFWPFSPIWDMPIANKQAQKINKEETIFSCEMKKNQKL